MVNKILIVCFDTPYPSNYGGVVDIERKFAYYKNNNIKVDLICTCFDQNRKKYFEEFIKNNQTIICNYYIELISVSILKIYKFISSIPFSVNVRAINYNNIEFLKTEKYSLVLIEHLKSTKNLELLANIINKGSEKPPFWLRLHNDEAEYYYNMYKASSSPKKIFFWSESLKYNKYQKKILNNKFYEGFLYISTEDKINLEKLTYQNSKNILLPIFYKSKSLKENVHKKIDFFYVGNLDLDDNLRAIHKINTFILDHDLMHYNITIAGKCTSVERQEIIKQIFSLHYHIQFKFNVSKAELHELYVSSKFFLNFSSNGSGVKTKLIEALDYRNLIISNNEGVKGSGYEGIVFNNNSIDINYLHQLLTNNKSYSLYLERVSNLLILKEEEVVKQYDYWLFNKIV